MNCFQNCIFTYDSQLYDFRRSRRTCCELLSELYFYLWFPTILWGHYNSISCELLSELYFYLWFPTFKNQLEHQTALWIAFRIVFLLMIPNRWRACISGWCVVNCFQNCIFTYDSQPWLATIATPSGCELLSELYFYLWFPTFSVYNIGPNPLWIAFRIVFLLMIPNAEPFSSLTDSVVNCFQNCIFTYDSQLSN